MSCAVLVTVSLLPLNIVSADRKLHFTDYAQFVLDWPPQGCICATGLEVVLKQSALLALKAALPLVLGFLGGVSATFWPAYHAAFCSGSLV